jgi:integrase
VIDKLDESGPLQGFFVRKQYEAVRRRLPPDPQAAIALAHTCGWRMHSEVLTLERRQLDLEAGTLGLDAGTTKNDDGRVVYLPPELKALLGGVSELVAMKITGHKTRAVFDRYIVSPGDLQEAARRIAGQTSGQSKGARLETRLASV